MYLTFELSICPQSLLHLNICCMDNIPYLKLLKTLSGVWFKLTSLKELIHILPKRVNHFGILAHEVFWSPFQIFWISVLKNKKQVIYDESTVNLDDDVNNYDSMTHDPTPKPQGKPIVSKSHRSSRLPILLDKKPLFSMGSWKN